MVEDKYPYEWTLAGADFKKNRGTVFSCFSCGGGSTMGYKLSGFDVIGCCEIDPQMIEIYKSNHNPKFPFLEGIQEFADRTEYPDELYDLDILDGSPPCSSFSMAGAREDGWGVEKKFTEGQTEQVLDTLFFDFIKLAKKLQPRVVIAENVKGLLLGAAQSYVNDILLAFVDAGYVVDYKLLNASKMGVPQRRERVFFHAIRKDLSYETTDLFGTRPRLDLNFNGKGVIFRDLADYQGPPINDFKRKAWDCRLPSDTAISDSKKHAGMKVNDYNTCYVFDDKVVQTITSKGEQGSLLFSKPIHLSPLELCRIGSFPTDYEFRKKRGYIIGMSVPPVMVAHIADAVFDQWLEPNREIN